MVVRESVRRRGANEHLAGQMSATSNVCITCQSRPRLSQLRETNVHARRRDGHDELEGSGLFCCLHFKPDPQRFFVGSSAGFSYTVSVGPTPVSRTVTGSLAVIAKCGA